MPATEDGLSQSWAHTHAHRMGGYLHNLTSHQHFRLANTHKSVFCLGFSTSVKGPNLEFAFSHLLIPWLRKRDLPLSVPSTVVPSPYMSLCCFQVMIHLHAYREGLGIENLKFMEASWLSPAAVFRICSKSKAPLPGKLPASFLLQKVLD